MNFNILRTTKKYFNLYTIVIEANFLFPNDQLIYLKKEIDNFCLKVKSRYKKVLNEKHKKIEGIETEKLYSLESQKNHIEMINKNYLLVPRVP